jgi:UDP-glucose 4-epimerase
VQAGAEVALLGPTPRTGPEVSRLIDAGQVKVWPSALMGTDLADTLSGWDSLVHLGYRFPTGSAFWSRLAEEISVNLLPTVSLLAAAAEAGVGLIAFASSVAVYGSARRGVTEDSEPDGELTPYALAKRQQEEYVRQWSRRTGRDAAILRLSTVYGPGETVARAIPNFIRSAMSGQSPILEGRGTREIDLIFVRDVVEAFLCVLERRANGTFNIASGLGRTPRAIAALVIRLCQAPVEIAEDQGALERGGAICDVSRAATRLGFRARTTLEAGLREEISWMRAAGAERRVGGPVS